MPPRRPIRLLAALAVTVGAVTPACLASAAAAPAQPAAPAKAGYTKTTLTFTVGGIPNETTGSGTQTCTVVADLFKPRSASPRRRVPAILTTNGFGGSKNDQDSLGVVAARHGYGLLSYSGLGFGGSGCRISLDDRAHDGKAGSALVSWLGGDPRIKAVDSAGHRVQAPNWIIHDRRDHLGRHDRYDPRVGMIGGSYGGEIQFAVAGVDPRVDALIPIITWNNLAYSLAPNNLASSNDVVAKPSVSGGGSGGGRGFTRGVTYSGAVAPGVEKFDWVSLFFALGIADGVEGASVDPSRDAGCVNFVQAACAAKEQMDALGYPDASTLKLATSASVASYIHRIRIPVLLAQGQADTLFNLQEAVATYRALRRQHTPVKMIWQSWGHSNGTAAPGEWIQGPGLLHTYEGKRFFAWFDHYLKGKRVSTGPRFAYYRDWVPFHGKNRPDTVQYATASHYPVGRARQLWLSGSNALVTRHGAVKAGTASYANPGGGAAASYSETSGVQGDLPSQSTKPTDTPGTFAAWSTGRLSRHVDVVGIPTVTVSLSCPTCTAAAPSSELQLFAKIYDVAPDGTVDLVHRLVAPVRAAGLGRPLTVQLPGIVHRFKAGHRIELVLAATDAAYRNADPVQPVTVTVAKGKPGVLRLPVTSGRIRIRGATG